MEVNVKIVENDKEKELLLSIRRIVFIKELNIFMYKDGDYYRALNRYAPTPFEGVAETFSDKDVEYWKKKALGYFNEFVAPNIEGEIPANGEIIPTAEASQGDSNAEMPF